MLCPSSVSEECSDPHARSTGVIATPEFEGSNGLLQRVEWIVFLVLMRHSRLGVLGARCS